LRVDPIRFLRTCFQANDWIAVFLKNYQDGRVVQRVGALSWVASDPVQAWLRAMNAHRFNVYVSVNAIGAGRRSRTRDAIVGIRHVFLEVDRDGPGVLRRVDGRADLPSPSYVLHSSENRVHIFWRVEGFDADGIERLQKHLANELRTDPAATPVTQTTRMPGYDNHKYDEPYRVWIEYRDVDRVFQPPDFPRADPRRTTWQPLRGHSHAAGARSRMERARRYIRQVPPAVAGQHGDVHTFRTCCRLTRGFALEDDQVLAVLTDWNAQCQPPWDEADLRDKIRRARLYGREPVGGML
jgi:hypothetical protein